VNKEQFERALQELKPARKIFVPRMSPLFRAASFGANSGHPDRAYFAD